MSDLIQLTSTVASVSPAKIFTDDCLEIPWFVPATANTNVKYRPSSQSYAPPKPFNVEHYTENKLPSTRSNVQNLPQLHLLSSMAPATSIRFRSIPDLDNRSLSSSRYW